MTQMDNQAQDMSVTQLAEQFEEIIGNYQTVLDATEKEKEDALVQVELYKAKTASLKAARDSLADSLKSRQPAEPVIERNTAELAKAQAKIEALTAERDSLQKALEQADERMRALEAEIKELKAAAVAIPAAEPAAPAFIEPANPIVLASPVAPVTAEPVAPIEPVAPVAPAAAPEKPAAPAFAEPANPIKTSIPAASVEPVAPVEAAPAPEVPAEPVPDFEDQKKMLLEMQEELARLEEQLRNEQ